MIDKEKLNRETPLDIFFEYLSENYPDRYPTEEMLSDFKRGKRVGILEIQRFLESIVEPKGE